MFSYRSLLRPLLPISVALLVAACGSTAVIKQPISELPTIARLDIATLTNATPKDGDQPPEHFLSAVRSYLKNELAKENRLALQPATANAKIDIKVVSYRMRSGVSRMMLGVFAGKDGIESEVTVKDVKTGKLIGSSTVSSYNVMAVGGEEDIARMHGEEIAKFILAKTK